MTRNELFAEARIRQRLRVVDPKASGMAQIAAAIWCSTLSEADASMNG
jgi:hypothetical protein